MQKLTFLGSDSGFGLNNNSAYFTQGRRFILFDCGMTVFNQVKDLIKEYDNLDIIITHLHNDHAGSLSQLIQYNYFILGKKSRIISKCEHIKTYLDITGTPVDIYEIVPNTEDINLVKTEHDKKIDAYGAIVNIDGEIIIYTGDTTTLEPFMPYMNEASELYVDMSKGNVVHLSIADAIEDLDKIHENGTEIYLMHTDDKEYIKKYINNKYKIM